MAIQRPEREKGVLIHHNCYVGFWSKVSSFRLSVPRKVPALCNLQFGTQEKCILPIIVSS